MDDLPRRLLERFPGTELTPVEDLVIPDEYREIVNPPQDYVRWMKTFGAGKVAGTGIELRAQPTSFEPYFADHLARGLGDYLVIGRWGTDYLTWFTKPAIWQIMFITEIDESPHQPVTKMTFTQLLELIVHDPDPEVRPDFWGFRKYLNFYTLVGTAIFLALVVGLLVLLSRLG